MEDVHVCQEGWQKMRLQVLAGTVSMFLLGEASS